MPFRFDYLCDLLETLETHQTHDPPYLPATLKDEYRKTVERWFRSHRARIDAPDTDGVALLSALFPERRTDRVYRLKEPSLVRVLGRCLSLGVSRAKELNGWREKGRGDLGDCVERVQRQAEMPVPRRGNEVTIEEMDGALAHIASKCRFSSPEVRRPSKEMDVAAADIDGILRPILHRMTSRDMKWFTRVLLKNYAPVIVPENLVLRSFHFLLPELLKFQDSFNAVVGLLRGPVIGKFPTQLGRQDHILYHDAAAKVLVPKVGTKVGRVPYLKARSIKHCVQMAGRRRMSLERKYDGEYCQIHIDLAKGKDWIQIFSKSGKDSTLDRAGIHETIRSSLRIGDSTCGFSSKCILEGELIVWSDKDANITEFHKLRKHVSRSGSFLGTAMDSQPHDFEHLMLIFYDVLLIDNDAVLTKPQGNRRKALEQLIDPIPGRADLVMREEIYFSSPDAPKRLQRAFASGITQRLEGFVLKPCDEPYFTMMRQSKDNYAGCWIKLKKDYIQGLGDTADFAVVGAGYDSKAAKTASIKNLSWTHFHIACLENKEDVLRFDAKPLFKVVDAVSQSINRQDLDTINQLGRFRAKPCGLEGSYEFFDVHVLSSLSQNMDVVFSEPFVFEIMGSGFDKPPNTDHFTLRFPRVLKIHWDRSFKDTVSFSEYEDMAHQARSVPVDATSQEDAAWIVRLEQADKGKGNALASWEDSQTVFSTPSNHGASPIRTSNLKRRKATESVPLVRVDTQEMLPEESRSYIHESSPHPTSHDSQSTAMSLPTPPASSSEETVKLYFEQSKVCAAGEPARSSKKRSADTRDLNSEGSNPKRRKSSAPDLHKATPKPAFPTKPGFIKAPLSEITNPSLRRKASPPVRAMTEPTCVKDVGRLNFAEQNDLPTTNVPQTPNPTPNPTPTEQPHQGDTPAEPSQTPPVPPITTNTPPLSGHPATPTTNKATARPQDVLTSTIVLLSSCIAQMPYLTENLLPPYAATVFKDEMRFVAYSSSSQQPLPPQSSRSSYTPNQTVHGPRRRKLVLVESNRPVETAWLIREISRIDIFQDIEFFDWRVLEDIRGLEEASELWNACWRARFAGRVRWDEAEMEGRVEWNSRWG